MDSSWSVAPPGARFDRISISLFEDREAPWPPSPDEPGCLASRARTILSRTAQPLSYPPPLPPARAIPGAPLLSAAASLQGRVQILVKSDKINSGGSLTL